MKTSLLFVYLLTCLIPIPAMADLNPLLADRMKKADTGRVIDVISINTLLLDSDEKIMLIGIKSDEEERSKKIQRDKHGFVVHDHDDPRLQLEEAMMHFMQELLLDKKVTIKFDVEQRNQNQQLEAYVYLPDGRMINEEILRQGYADLQLRPPNMKYADRLREAYREASHEQRGIHGR